MRQFIEFKVFGSTMSEISENALKEWREYSQNEEAELPRDTEIHVTPGSVDNHYIGDVLIRIRTEK